MEIRGVLRPIALFASPASPTFHTSTAVHARARRGARSDMTGSRRYVTRVYLAAEQTENVSRLDHMPLGRRTKARTNALCGVVVVIDG